MKRFLSIGAAAALFALAIGVGCGSTARRSDFGADPNADAGSDGSIEQLPEEDAAGFGTGTDSGPVRIDLDSGCATARAAGEQSPVYMDIVLDGSGSMSGTKWTAATDALRAVFKQYGQQNPTDPSVGIGMFIFADKHPKSSSGCATDDFTQIFPFIDAMTSTHAGQLTAWLDDSDPCGGTPLREAVEGQIKALQALILPSTTILKKPGKKVLVVMTDGVPNGGTTDQSAIISAAQLAAGNTGDFKVNTFVIGIGNPTESTYAYDEQFLGKVAVAGGTSPQGCDPNWNETSPPSAKPCHFQITPGAKTAQQVTNELIQAIDAIRGAAKGCEFTLDKSGSLDPAKVNVVYKDGNGSEVLIGKDANNGWKYDDDNNPSKVILTGKACSDYMSVGMSKIEIVLGCQSVVN